MASAVNGMWGNAIEVLGTAPLDNRGAAQVDSLSCGSAGSCSGGGGYTDNSSIAQAFVVSER